MTAVAIALEAPAAADQGRRQRRVETRELFQRFRLEAGDRGGAGDRPRLGGGPQFGDAGRVIAEERLVGQTALEQVAVQGERDRQVGARPQRQVQVGLLGERRPPWVDDDERGALALRLADVRHQVDAGRRRVDAPQHDQARGGVVLVGDARHLAVETEGGGAGRRGADRPRQA